MATPPVQVPTFKTRSFKQECDIADRKEDDKPPAPVVGYEFSNGRKFDDSVSKNKTYD